MPDFEVPEQSVDLDAPSEPKVRHPVPGPGGKVSVTVTAERGSTITVSEEYGDEVASATATGGLQTLTFKARTGKHTYDVTATDAAGNESDASDTFSVESDSTRPDVDSFAVMPVNPVDAAVHVSFSTSEDAHYRLTVSGRDDEVAGDAEAGTTVIEPLWLPDGRYELMAVVEDAAGNITRRTERFTVELDSLEPMLIQGDAFRISGVPLSVEGPAEARAVVHAGTTTRKVTLDKAGSAEIVMDLPDGTYRPQVDVVDRFGRHGSVEGDPFVVDTRAPELKVDYDKAAARHGDPVMTVTAEASATVVLSDGGTRLVRQRVSSSGKSLRFMPKLRPGRHRISIEVSDRVGNSTTRTLVVDVGDKMTTAEILRTVALALVILLVLGVIGLLLWRRRRTFIVWWARRREAARVAAELRVQAAREERLRIERERYERELAVWRREHRELGELLSLARTLDGEVYGTDRFRWGRPKKGERVLHVFPGRLVELRSRQGVTTLAETDHGEVAVTDRRVLFTGATKRREWDYSRWLGHEHHQETSTLIMVSNRQKTSGIAYALQDARRIRVAIDVALADHEGSRDEVVRRARRALENHQVSRPEPPCESQASEPVGSSTVS
ncbi:Ig-like domain-containing protein [Streptomyces sp. NPDC048208]|uniref:Ig-like domain-containing protein n=1 Tax=Streptomyces sp. NPDC048208 TaxID=3365515 RepID=UPI00372331E3